MSRDQWFDRLARDTAQGLSRRQVVARLLGGGALAVFSSLALRQADTGKIKDCGKLCEECCNNAFPDHGHDYGQCVSDCQHGEGLCGPIVCPGG